MALTRFIYHKFSSVFVFFITADSQQPAAILWWSGTPGPPPLLAFPGSDLSEQVSEHIFFLMKAKPKQTHHFWNDPVRSELYVAIKYLCFKPL